MEDYVRGGEEMEFIEITTLFIGVAIIVAGGTTYSGLEKLAKTMTRQK